MKRLIALFALLILFALMTTVAVYAQDTPVPTDEISAETAEPTALATDEAAGTQEVIIIVTQTPENSPTPTLTPTPEMTAVPGTGGDGDGGTGGTGDTVPPAGMNPDLVFVGLVLLSLIFGLADKFSNYTLSKKLAEAIPADWQPVIEQGANTARRIVYERAGAFADSTESPVDNNLLNEEMKRAGWEFYTAADGVQHARKIVTPAG